MTYRPRTFRQPLLQRARYATRFLSPRAVALLIGLGAALVLLAVNPMLAAMCIGFTCVVVLT